MVHSPKKHLKAIIFDMDGTIVDSEKAWHVATKRMLADFGIVEFSDEHHHHLQSLTGMGLANTISKIKSVFDIKADHAEIARIILDHSNSLFSEGIDYIAGFEAFHQFAQENNIPTCIATNADNSTLAHFKKSMHLENFFGQRIFNITHVDNRPKPDPALFLHAAKELGADPAECIVFEDSLVGFNAARAAGMKCIAIKNNGNQHFLDQVAAAIESYEEAPHRLKEMFEIISHRAHASKS